MSRHELSLRRISGQSVVYGAMNNMKRGDRVGLCDDVDSMSLRYLKAVSFVYQGNTSAIGRKRLFEAV